MLTTILSKLQERKKRLDKYCDEILTMIKELREINKKCKEVLK